MGSSELVVLKGIDLEIEPSRICVLVGPSGCGKTTLLRHIAGLLVPTEGRVTIDGLRVDGPSPQRPLIFQELTVFPWMTVRRNVEYALHSQESGRIRNCLDDILSLTGLRDRLDAYPKTLSAGMAKLVEIARAFALSPPVVLGDEPFTNLDALTRRRLRDILLRVWRELGSTMILSSHDIEEAMLLADEVVVLGGRPTEVRARVEIPFERPRGDGLVFESQFVALRQHIEGLLQPQGDSR